MALVNKKVLIITLLCVGLLATAAVFILVVKQPAPEVEQRAPQTTKQTPATTDRQQPTKGVYTEYSKQKLAETSGTKLLFFHAPWCPQCRSLDKSIRESELPDNLTIFKVDYDTNQSLRQKYGVTIQTTVVKVDDNGEKIASFVAYSEPNFESIKSSLLQ